MSIESARAFYERMFTDEAFQTQYQSAATNDERREMVLAAGYNFTPEEWETALAQISESPDSELSDAELSAVSGGLLPFPGPLPEPHPGLIPKGLPGLPPAFPLYGAPVE